MDSRRILLIDDEDDIREIAALSLEATVGWETSTAECGSAGVAKAIAAPPDAILLDVMMPDMDGPETFLELRRHAETAATPVIFLTAKAQAAERRGLLETGANGVIAKPFDPLTLASEISVILGWPE